MRGAVLVSTALAASLVAPATRAVEQETKVKGFEVGGRLGLQLPAGDFQKDRPMSEGTPFANVLLVATLGPPRSDA